MKRVTAQEGLDQDALLKAATYVNDNLRKEALGHQNVFHCFKFWQPKEEPAMSTLNKLIL